MDTIAFHSLATKVVLTIGAFGFTASSQICNYIFEIYVVSYIVKKHVKKIYLLIFFSSYVLLNGSLVWN